MPQSWPRKIWIVRHGESAGNVARDLAEKNGIGRIDIDLRDVDIPLSDRGHEQAEALGRWFADRPSADRPTVVVVSPYVRAVQTAETIDSFLERKGEWTKLVKDERLREREFGVLDRLTKKGIIELFPDQAEFRRILGKFYHRPPGGESWSDVILRLRSVLDTISLHYADQQVLIVAHQVVVLCLRYIFEEMDEAEILKIDAEGDVANCGVTEYAFEPGDKGGKLKLVRYNFVAPLEEAGAEVTTKQDAPVAAR